MGVASISCPLPYSEQNDESAQVSLLREELRKKESVSLCLCSALLCYVCPLPCLAGVSAVGEEAEILVRAAGGKERAGSSQAYWSVEHVLV